MISKEKFFKSFFDEEFVSDCIETLSGTQWNNFTKSFYWLAVGLELLSSEENNCELADKLLKTNQITFPSELVYVYTKDGVRYAINQEEIINFIRKSYHAKELYDRMKKVDDLYSDFATAETDAEELILPGSSIDLKIRIRKNCNNNN